MYSVALASDIGDDDRDWLVVGGMPRSGPGQSSLSLRVISLLGDDISCSIPHAYDG